MRRSLLFLCFVLTSYQSFGNGASLRDDDIVVIAYNSYDARSNTLVFASADENEYPSGDFSTVNAGLGHHLWAIDEEGPELKRGWMFRLRLTIQAVIDEYNRRGNQDFIAMVSDASDVYVSRSFNGKTVTELKRRFVDNFAQSKIVFSTQIYCCNPWELHTIGRADWDRHYEETDGPDSIYEHLNAGLYMGYASAIIQMADEMRLWETDYHRHESFHSLIGTKVEKDLRMEDLEVDDDEWQISAWFFRDQAKPTPLSKLDFNQDLFAVTGTFRAQEREDGYKIFSRNHFLEMFGPFPSDFSAKDLAQLTVCPYNYNHQAMEWTNVITGGHPLIFHFAGNDWLCACAVFAAEGFQSITEKFRDNCLFEFSKWSQPVNDAIQSIALAQDPSSEMVASKALSIPATSLVRRLDDDPFGRKLGDDGPYGRRLGDDGPYGRKLGDDGPYGRKLGDDGPYGRKLGDDGPYGRMLGDDGPYGRKLGLRLH